MTPQPLEWTMTGIRPLSLNNAFANVKGVGRVKSADYKAWQTEFVLRARNQKAPRFEGPVAIDIVAYTGNNDIDNIAKPIIDSLKAAYVIIDDGKKYVRDVRCRYSDHEDETLGCMITVRGLSPSLQPQRAAE